MCCDGSESAAAGVAPDEKASPKVSMVRLGVRSHLQKKRQSVSSRFENFRSFREKWLISYPFHCIVNISDRRWEIDFRVQAVVHIHHQKPQVMAENPA